jgi:hypothetical protein
MLQNDDFLSLSALEHYVQSVCPRDYVEDLLSSLREYVDDDLPHYTDSLRGAFLETEPVFTRTQYAEFFWHCASTVPGWLPQVVLANADAESQGSAKLLSMWKCIQSNDFVADQVMDHAKDESRHSRIFLRMTGYAFPNIVPDPVLNALSSTLPDVRNKTHLKGGQAFSDNVILDQLIQMNIGEIRTRLHMFLLAPIILAFTPQESRRTVRRLLRGLVQDEVRHIGYTARLVETWAETGNRDLIHSLYAARIHDFHKLTVDETEEAVRQYGNGKFPALLEI